MPKGSETPNDGNKRFLYIIALVSALGGLLFGYDTGVISGAILFIRQGFVLSDFMVEVVVSAVLLGASVGAALGGYVADRFGRRKTILLSAAIFTSAAVGTAYSPSIEWLIFGRTIVGIAIGLASIATPLYISEISPANARGSLVSLNQLAITSGIVVSYLVDYGFSASGGWRYMLGLAAIPAIILGFGMLPLPETPRWLISHKEPEKARKVLGHIQGALQIDGAVKEIQASLEKQAGGRGELFNPLVKPALIIGISLAIFQQVTGINTVIYYAPTIFQFAGFVSASSAIMATIGVGIVNIAMTVVAILLLDRVGRRPLLLLGLAGMVFSLSLLGTAFFFPTILGSLGWISVVGLMLYVGSFAIGLGPVFWLLISEIYPLKVRGLAMSIASEANWGSNLIITITFLTLIQNFGKSGTFWLYAVVGVAAWVFVYLRVPETKKKTLEEIEEHWRKGRHPLEMHET